MVDSGYDIVIVGGGPAGLSTWLHLQALAPELAARTLLIEKATYPRDKPCGGGLTPLADRLLGGLGIEIGSLSLPVHTIELRNGDGTRRFRQPNALRIVWRRELDQVLARTAVGRGLTLHQDEAFIGFHRVAGGLRVTTTRGSYGARVVVGADGVFSIVRKQIAPANAARLARLVEILTFVEPTEAPFSTATAVFDLRPIGAGLQGYVWHFPCLRDGRPAVHRGVYDSRMDVTRPRVDLKQYLSAALDADAVVTAGGARVSYPVRWFGPGAVVGGAHVVLVGDAAGVDAALGEGIAPSLDYGDFAANCLVDAFARNDFGFVDVRARLLAHPLGRALRLRYALAKRLYDGDSEAAVLLPQVIAGRLPA